jgi:hypothetical protein
MHPAAVWPKTGIPANARFGVKNQRGFLNNKPPAAFWGSFHV